MKPLNGFIASIFLLLLIIPFSGRAQQTDCRKVDLTVEITDSRNGNNGSIKVSAKDDQAGFRLILTGKGIGRDDIERQSKSSANTIGNVKPGTYDLTIYYEDTSYCTETRKVTVN
jgi:uncharacterized protein (DUF2141 family)